MLSVLLGSSADNLAHLVRFYAPAAERMLDVTYGSGTWAKQLSIPVIGIDCDPTSTPVVRADLRRLPFVAGCFDLAGYDPPYLYGSLAMHMGPIGRKTWNPARSTWKRPEQLAELSGEAARELHRVVRPGGCVIAKIMDSRYKGRLVRNHDIVTGAFEQAGWTLRDHLVYIRTVTGSYTNPRTAQCAHGYFLIFQRSDETQDPAVTARTPPDGA